jgi:hypothetical protein
MVVVNGLLQLEVFHNRIRAAIGFDAAILIIFLAEWRRRRNRRLPPLVAVEEQRMIPEAVARARANLDRVVKLLGADGTDPMWIKLKVGRWRFVVGQRSVYRYPGGAATCYYPKEPMPFEEAIANALLLLHNNPRVFDKWCRRDGGFYI